MRDTEPDLLEALKKSLKPTPLAVGTRVRHVGEQYPAAYEFGTGNIVAVVRYYPQDRTYEYMVLCDEAPWGGTENLVSRNHIVAVDPVAQGGVDA